MKLKTVSLVIGGLAAASVAVYLSQRPATAVVQDARVGSALLPAETAAKAIRLRLSEQGRSVTLARQADGSWTVPDYHGFPADFRKLSQLVDELLRTKVDRFVTASPERLARYEFKDTRIVLEDAEGKALWTLVLGKNTETGGRLVKFDGVEKAYQARLNAWLDPDPKNWADSSLVNLKAEDVAAVEISFPGEPTVTLKRAKKEDAFACENTPAGQRVKADKVTSLLGSLGTLRFSDTAPTDDPRIAEAAPHARTVRLTRFDGTSVQVVLSRKPEQKVLKALETAKKDEAASASALKAAAEAQLKEDGASAVPEAKPAGELGQTETIPAGPVFVVVSNTEPGAVVNEMMKKRSFQVYEFTYTGLPAKAEELFEPAPAPAPAPEASKQP